MIAFFAHFSDQLTSAIFYENTIPRKFSLSTSGAPPFTSVQEADSFLTTWTQDLNRTLNVSFDPPGSLFASTTTGSQPTTICFYLIEIVPVPSLRGTKRPPLQANLNYLVTSWGQNQHHILTQFMFAVMENPQLEVRTDPLPLVVWSSFGIPPRPSFLLQVPLRLERLERNVPLVREGRLLPIPAHVNVYGRIQVPNAGRNNQPITLSAAQVSIDGLDRSVTTDTQGHFHLPNVQPNAQGEIELRITARGHTLTHTISETGAADAPVLIDLPLPLATLNGRILTPANQPLTNARIEFPNEKQYVITRPDGRFIFDGAPANLQPHQLAVTQNGRPLTITPQTNEWLFQQQGSGSPSEPVVIQFKL